MNMNELMQYVTYLVAAIGVMAFVVSVITQVIKEMPGLKNIPTATVVVVLSLVLGRLGARGRDLASDEIQREEIEGGDPDISRGSLGHGCHCDIATGRIAPPLHIIKEKRANR